jgi:hypothetical protein
MWVKGALLHFIVDSGRIQKNLISTEVIKLLEFSTTPHCSRTTSGGSTKEKIFASANNDLPYGIKPFKDEVLCDVYHIAEESIVRTIEEVHKFQGRLSIEI